MEKLDLFSRFESNLYKLTVYISFIIPIGIVYIVDILYLEEYDWFIRFPIGIVCFFVALLVWFIALTLFFDILLEPTFKIIRRITGRKPLKEVEKEIREKNDEEEERKADFFTNRPESDQRYSLWHRQEIIAKELKKEIHDLKILVFVMLALIIAISLHTFL